MREFSESTSFTVISEVSSGEVKELVSKCYDVGLAIVSLWLSSG
jgi:hypothetical protein